MFLGYSEKDESLLRRHNNLTVLDAVSSLDNFMREEVNNQVKRLTLTLPHIYVYSCTIRYFQSIRHLSSRIEISRHVSRTRRKICFDPAPGIERILSRLRSLGGPSSSIQRGEGTRKIWRSERRETDRKYKANTRSRSPGET